MTEAPDLLVVGGGPAGLATALCARRAGLAVTVVDRRRPPLDKACGEGLMPDGVAALAALGVPAAALAGAPFAGIRYRGDGRVAEGRFPGPPGLGVRRVELHRALAEQAGRAGVEVRWGVRVTGLEPLGTGAGARFAAVTAAGERLGGRVLVAADGLRSPLRGWAGLAAAPPAVGPRRRFGVRRHYRVPAGEAPELVEVWWGRGVEAYVTPVARDEIGVAMLWSGRRAGFDELLAGFPELARRLEGRPATSRDRGAGPLRQPVRAVVRGNLALVGDAAGYVDALTGEGLSLAFRQAAALAAAAAAGDLGSYARACRRQRRLPDLLTELLLAVERRPRLRRRTLAALAADPTLFSRLLALHAGQLSAAAFGVSGTFRLAWGLARGGARAAG